MSGSAERLTVAVLGIAIGLVLIFVSHGRGAPPLRDGFDGARYRLSAEAAREARVRPVPGLGPLLFVHGTPDADVRLVRDVLGGARPEAQSLLLAVAPLTTIKVQALSDAAGIAQAAGEGWLVTLDLDRVRTGGPRAVRRLVLHEMGHVVDQALVPTAVEAELDALTPAGWGCAEGRHGACASRSERFAESFAKWASGDIGEGVYLGYRVPPPPPSWGDPLRRLR